MITTEYPFSIVQVLNRFGKAQMKPECIKWYNTFMKGIDKSDMMMSYYDCLRKGTKWFRKLFFHQLDMAMHNAYILFVKQNPTLKVSLLEFRLEVIRKLLNAPEPPGRGKFERKSPKSAPAALAARNISDESLISLRRHKPVAFPSLPDPKNQRQKYPSKRCVVCEERSSFTRYYCNDCPGKPALCCSNTSVSCWHKYHKQRL